MRTLFLHIGQGKTGTSYAQTTLAISRAALREQGVAYPVTKKIIKNIDDNLNAGGNGLGLCNAFDYTPALKQLELPSEGNVLLSYEGLISRFMFEDSDVELDRLCERHKFDRVSFLIFCRNPISHAVSSYRQLVKRSGMSKTLNIYCENYNSPRQLARFIEKYTDRPDTSIRVRNYSVCKNALMSEFSIWLSVPESIFTKPSQDNVNRSMTLAELMLQRELNLQLDECVELFADPLFENLPKVQPEKLLPGFGAQQALLDRLRPHMNTVNEFMNDPEHHYEEDIVRPKGHIQMREKYELTLGQIAALAKVYAKFLDK